MTHRRPKGPADPWLADWMTPATAGPADPRLAAGNGDGVGAGGPAGSAERGQDLPDRLQFLVQQQDRVGGHGQRQRAAQRVLRPSGRHDGEAGPAGPQRLADQAGHLARLPPPQVVVLVDDDPAEPGGDARRRLPHQVVPAVPGQGDGGNRVTAPGVVDQPAHHRRCGGVVSVVDDDRAARHQVAVAAARGWPRRG